MRNQSFKDCMMCLKKLVKPPPPRVKVDTPRVNVDTPRVNVDTPRVKVDCYDSM